MNRKSTKINAFTLAEVLITLGVIGVVVAVTMPTLLTNVQERVRKEQVRTVKYKLTKATEKMNSLGKIGHYDSTMDFVNELKKHLSIAKICDNDHLAECWSGAGFTNANGAKSYVVADLKTGQKLDALQFNSGDMDTVGIVTGDGTPIILTYGKECTALDETKQYNWSTVDGKPETNATAGCVSLVFDINGKKGPNKLGGDVRTMNSLLGMVNLGNNYNALNAEECEKYSKKLGIKFCGAVENDMWAGALKACNDIGLHLISPETLVQIVYLQTGVNVERREQVKLYNSQSACDNDNEVQNGTWKCKVKPQNYSSPLTDNFAGTYWASTEINNENAWARYFYSYYTSWHYNSKSSKNTVLCTAD